MLAGSPFLVLFSALGIVRTAVAARGAARWAGIAGWLILLALTAGYVALYLRRAGVAVTAGSVEISGAIRHRSVPLADVGDVVLVDALVSSVRSDARLFLLDRSGRRIASFPEGFWSRDDLDHIAGLVDAPHHHLGRVTAKELRAQFPHAVGWVVAHPVKFAAWFTLGWVLVAVAVSLVVAPTSG